MVELVKQRVLILCTGNSARSQMAVGLLRALAGERFEVSSAGSAPSELHPLAVRAMAERAIDISGQRSKHFEQFLAIEFDHVITVCDRAAESCPAFPGPAHRWHWSFPDPAAAVGSKGERLEAFRRVRDALGLRLERWLEQELDSSLPASINE